ncbi:ATP phosphoribosyltransferase regulatory subunit [Curvibacter sp. HBC28]|uniref:site-specific DNA-methyltransferase (adenine-specific) n=1 Tax=Curvibacter microcysteis TaxID=3026419 RepID=A0ABT5MAG8_9BURK|nr:DNA methyltransferase [Curvibacter sp. HBC28]MDD0813385.1 ATP phosphoribosyltransferase regulatory subunit [Curvibacter sp. HBC28]
MSAPSVHDGWLSLIEISGPFLAVSVLKESFPQGLEELDATKRKRLRQAYEEWREAMELEDSQFAELHVAWIDEVLSRGLELDEAGKGDVLKRADWCAANLLATLPEHGVTLSPDHAVVDEQHANKPLLLIQTYVQDVDIDATLKQDGWAATPADRMVQLCRSLGCRLGLVTNGERWMLVDAPVGAVTTFVSWYARIWSQEPITLQAFVHLLGIRRFFVDESEQLPALFDRSLKFQDEVTDALGEQVRRAVEVLIQTLDKADQDRNRELLHDVKEPELYEAALTVMMRLVFLLSAEERGLLLMGDERYEANYALSTLRMQLRKESEEILERRWDAWSRLLAIFRAVFGGIEHENLRLPALGGSLFDPDRFPFLEGRPKGSNWRSDAAKPLPIDNRTVLLLLEAIQQFQGRTLSYRALDVEQIGYVYEGLLERTVKRTDEVTLELDATKSAKTPWVKLAELDSARLDGAVQLTELLQERSGSSASRVRNDLAKPVDDTFADRLLTACLGDTKMRDRIKPYAHLLRTDPWGYPLVYPAGAFIVTTGSDRRETGTHYTPKSLTEAIVAETLRPVAYVGPAEGTPRDQWILKSPAELLNLKICDPAMGSGAFLVQACRWLSDRLVEAWSQVEATGETVCMDGEVLEAGVAKAPLPRDSEARTVIARRLIAERCLYGVDLNPLAVELAKLSIWLVTLAKGRPFGFLDHNLRCGDSLLGIHRLDQLTQLSMNPTGQGQLRLFGQNIEQAVREAIELRQQLRAIPIRDIRDVEAMAHLDADARRRLEVAECIANAFIGEVLAAGGNDAVLKNALASLAIQAGQAIDGNHDVFASMHQRSMATLSTDLPGDKTKRRPFHWPLEFGEVFGLGGYGFDAIVGNPPFLGGTLASATFGVTYMASLQRLNPPWHGKADLVVGFFKKAAQLLQREGKFSFISTASILRGESLDACLRPLTTTGWHLYSARSPYKWPGSAMLEVVNISFSHGWQGNFRLNDRDVTGITEDLLPKTTDEAQPFVLASQCLSGKLGAKLSPANREVSYDNYRESLKEYPELDAFMVPTLGGKEIYGLIDFMCAPRAISKGKYSQWLSSIPDHTRHKTLLNAEAYAHSAPALALQTALSKSRLAFACGETSTLLNFCAVPHVDAILKHKLVVFPANCWGLFSILQSNIHLHWAWRWGLRRKSDFVYSPKRCADTFPLPDSVQDQMDDFPSFLSEVGEKYHERRHDFMMSSKMGLTKLNNLFHDPEYKDQDVCKLRDLQIDVDSNVMRAYNWGDINLEHGFHEVPYLPENDRIRFTISESARIEVLRRLSDLNRKRYLEEVAQGVHSGGKTRTSIPAKSGQHSKTASDQSVNDLFAGGNA